MARIPIGEARELYLTDDELAHLIRHIEGTAPRQTAIRPTPLHRCYCWRNSQGRHDCPTPQACALPEFQDADQRPDSAGALLWPLGVAVALLVGLLGWMAW